MNVGLFFGSFNPVHVGHLIIANYFAQNTALEQVWLVVTPQNPLKTSHTLLNEYHRFHLVQLAVEDNPLLKESNIEFKLLRPSYTVDTLTYLTEKYPQHAFSVILGSDSYANLSKWKNADLIQKNFPILIYNRPGFDVEVRQLRQVTFKPPMLDVSASLIRKMIRDGKSIRYFVPDKVLFEIERCGYYK